MTVRNFSDQGFEDFRKQRKRMLAKLGPQGPAAGYENQALRELEQVEAREVREQQLTREVHDFFQAATKQAASIVDRVARDVQQETGAKVEQEMESFLIESLARMNTFVLNVLHQKRGPVAETRMEPHVGNLVGQTLDEFRWAGTADVGDKHIGQDPFATPVDDVTREFRQIVGAAASAEEVAVPIDQHLVATVQQQAGSAVEESLPEVAPMPRTTAAAPAKVAPAEAMPKSAMTTAPEAPPAAASATPAAATTAASEDLERFKNALKALVRQGVMNKDEARAAWQARLASLGLQG